MTDQAEVPTGVEAQRTLARWMLELHGIRSPILRYGFAVVSVAVGLGLALLLNYRQFRDVEVPVLTMSIALTTWYAGTGPSVLAIVLSTLCFDYFFTEPFYSFSISSQDLPYFLVFIAWGGIVSAFSAIRRRIDDRLRQARDRLQVELDERKRREDEIRKLNQELASQAIELQTYIKNLRQTTAENERLESELRVARDIQMSFLKKIFPAFPTRSDFSIHATIEPAREVGGDLYDFGLVDQTRLVFYVGDVSDKGVPAALVMAETMTLMKLASQQTGITPAEILRQVNVALSAQNESCTFVTLFIGILDLKTGELSFSNAGHNPPLILGANGESRFVTLPDGLVLGITPDAEYRDVTVCLEPGDMIVTYTDGVTEAMNPDRKLYSEAHLRETVATLAGRGVRDTVAEIVASVRIHAAGAPQSDDIAVLALRRDFAHSATAAV